MPKLKNAAKKRNKKPIAMIESSGNVFQDLGFGKESANLLLRADLMIAITYMFHSSGWTNTQAAKALGVKESRISELRHGQISKFSANKLN